VRSLLQTSAPVINYKCFPSALYSELNGPIQDLEITHIENQGVYITGRELVLVNLIHFKSPPSSSRSTIVSTIYKMVLNFSPLMLANSHILWKFTLTILSIHHFIGLSFSTFL